MSYLVLARKYRPRTFGEVAGQVVATRVLQGALREGRIGHAYLFSGPRGTGKTTSARIFAKALNCERGPTPDPCGECARCRGIEQGSDVDVIEIDAASNRGIDDARALREEVAYAPMHSRFKVYIVDEVHMLTKEAFNALLKTLEEPPPHVKFLFATTEPHKVIETIRSRCQIVALSLIGEGVIASALSDILGREGIRPGVGVVEELARQARGSMRDALSLTDQLLALVGDAPTVEDVRRLAGPASAELVARLVERIQACDQAAVLSELVRLEGGESELTGALIEHLRLALVCVLAAGEAELLVPDSGRREALASFAKGLGPARLQVWLQELLTCRERIAALPEHARVVLEVTLLDLAREEATLPLGALVGRLEALEARLGAGAPPVPGPAGRPNEGAAPSVGATASAPRSERRQPSAPPPATGPATGPGGAAPGSRGSSPRAALAGPEVTAGGSATALAEPPAPPPVASRVAAPPAPAPLPVATAGPAVEVGPASGKATGRGAGRVEWKTGRPAPPPAADDDFTREVTDLFTGSIET